MDAVTVASANLMSALSQFDAASAKLSNTGTQGAPNDPNNPTIEQIASVQQFHAAERTLSVADTMYKITIDMKV